MNETEKKILIEEKKIEKLEKKIANDEKFLTKTLQSKAFKTALSNGKHLQSVERTRRKLTAKIAKHRFIFALLVVTGVVLVWRGIWEYSATLPFLSYSLVALIVGIIILWLLGKYTDLN